MNNVAPFESPLNEDIVLFCISVNENNITVSTQKFRIRRCLESEGDRL